MAGMYAAKVLTRNPLFRTFGDQASILNYLQSVSAMLKIAPKSLTCSNLFDPVFTKSADEPISREYLLMVSER
jgi:hypothetical protein